MIKEEINKLYNYIYNNYIIWSQTKKFRIFYIIFIFVFLYDVISTRYWIHIWLKEWNDIMKNIVYNHYIYFVLLKVGCLWMDIFFIKKYLKRNKKYDKRIVYWSVYGMSIFYILVALSNTISILFFKFL